MKLVTLVLPRPGAWYGASMRKGASLLVQTLPLMMLADVCSHKDFTFPLQPSTYATNSTTPPASLIFLSASRLKNLALTTMGISGIRPLPNTFE